MAEGAAGRGVAMRPRSGSPSSKARDGGGSSGLDAGGGSDEADDAHLEKIARNFNEWVEKAGLPVNKLKTVRIKGMRLGTVAAEPISAEDVYISVPSKLCLDRESAKRSRHG